MSVLLRVPTDLQEVYIHRTEMAAAFDSINSEDLFVSIASESDEESESGMEFQLSDSDEDVPELLEIEDLNDVEMVDAELATPIKINIAKTRDFSCQTLFILLFFQTELGVEVARYCFRAAFSRMRF